VFLAEMAESFNKAGTAVADRTGNGGYA